MLRFAPSPTKDMDINNLRVALLNHIISKQQNKELLIRIDDTDKQNIIEGKDKEILELLSLFGIDYSRAVHQSENIKYHTQMAMKLLLDKKAFNCFCSDEALAQDKQKAQKEGKAYSYSGFCETISDETKFHCNAPFVVRLKKPQQNISFKDSIKGNLNYTQDEVDSVIILNHDKTPTYNFACAVDDMLFDISTIVRNEEQLDNTPKQINIMESLGYSKDINYIHIPSVKNSISVKELIDQGYLPAAIANYIVMLGFDTPSEIFTIEEAIEWFDINNLSKENIEFDIEKLNEINKLYLKDIDELRLSKILGYADKDIGTLGKLFLNNSSTIKEIKTKIDTIFAEKKPQAEFKNEFDAIKECLEKAPFIKELEELKKHITKQTNLNEEKLAPALTYILTGQTSDVELNEVYPLIRNYLGEIV